MAVKEAARPSARERLLAAANELFYDEGVHTVGIDRVIEQAGVAKASLYNTFGSKDELVRTYLQTRRPCRGSAGTGWRSCPAGAVAPDAGGIHSDEVRRYPLDPRLEPGIDERRALSLGIQMVRRSPY